MNENKQGMVIPFALSAGKMRRSAAAYRRHGQVLEALTLIRRAAEQEDTAEGWQLLAAELRQLGCYEAAAGLLGRALSRKDCPLSAWVDMARCQLAMGREALAADCANHPLREDPWSPAGDAARDAIMDMGFPEEKERSRRALRMAQRGMAEWQLGDKRLGERRIQRSLRLLRDQERLLITLALMCMLHDDYAGAMRYLARSLRRDKTSAPTLCTLSAVLQQMGHPRAARAFLHRAGGFCETLRDDEQFLTSAWAIGAWKETGEYLSFRMKKYPHRTVLLNAQAAMLYETGRADEAREVWRHVLSIDPDDRQAATFLEATANDQLQVLPVMGRIPAKVMIRQHGLVCREGLTAETLLKPGTQEHRVLVWLATSHEEGEQLLALRALRLCSDEAAEKRFLREILCRPGVAQNMSRLAVMRLAELGDREPMQMLMGDYYSLVQCQKKEAETLSGGWRKFLPLLLRETRHDGDSASIAEFAAVLWKAMTPAQRRDAAGNGGYLWCKAMEILWLNMNGQEEAAVGIVRRMPVSPRKVSRVLRRLGRILMNENE